MQNGHANPRDLRAAGVVFLGSAAGAAAIIGAVVSAQAAHALSEAGMTQCGGFLTPSVLAQVNADGGIDDVSPIQLADIAGDTTQTAACLVQTGANDNPADYQSWLRVNEAIEKVEFNDFQHAAMSVDGAPTPNVPVAEISSMLAINMQLNPSEIPAPDQLAMTYLDSAYGSALESAQQHFGGFQYGINAGDISQVLQLDTYRIGPQLYSPQVEENLASDLAQSWNESAADHVNRYAPTQLDLESNPDAIGEQSRTFVQDYFTGVANGLNLSPDSQLIEDTENTVWEDMIMNDTLDTQAYYDSPSD